MHGHPAPRKCIWLVITGTMLTLLAARFGGAAFERWLRGGWWCYAHGPVPPKRAGIVFKRSLTLALGRRKTPAFSRRRTLAQAALCSPHDGAAPAEPPLHLLFVGGPGRNPRQRDPRPQALLPGGWRRAAQRLCGGRLSSVVIAILLHLVMCTDVLGKHPGRRLGSISLLPGGTPLGIFLG